MTKSPLLAALLAASAMPAAAEPLAEALAGAQAAAGQNSQSVLLVRLERVARQRDEVLKHIEFLADATPRVGISFFDDGMISALRRGGPAAAAGLGVFDTVKQVDGRAMPADAKAIIAAMNASASPSVTVERRVGGRLTVTLDKRSIAASPAVIAGFKARASALSDQIQPLDHYIRAGDANRDTLAKEISDLLSALVSLQQEVLNATYEF